MQKLKKKAQDLATYLNRYDSLTDQDIQDALTATQAAYMYDPELTAEYDPFGKSALALAAGRSAYLVEYDSGLGQWTVTKLPPPLRPDELM